MITKALLKISALVELYNKLFIFVQRLIFFCIKVLLIINRNDKLNIY
jgi:hypothetical protein